jgi:hypothetical protein
VPPLLLVGLILGQTASAPTVDAAELERIRKALEQPAPLQTVQAKAVDSDTRPVFRLTVHGRALDDSPLKEWTTPSYIRPSYPLYHNEMLMMWTPEAFRASVLYPGAVTTPFGGVGVSIPVTLIVDTLVKQTKAELKRRREAKARQEVHDALAALLACRADPSRPGC